LIKQAIMETHRPNVDPDVPPEERLDLTIRKMAHDLNNLLTVIHGNAELARMDLEAKHPASESLNEIHHACLRSRDLVGQILKACHQYGDPHASTLPAAATPATSPTTVPAKPSAGSQAHILLVDDESAFITLAERLLKRGGYRVTSFLRPEQAVAEFQQNPGRFDLVITDIHMPGLSGFELASALRQIRPQLNIILISGALHREEIERAKQDGIRTVFSKPDTADDFARIIQKVFPPESGRCVTLDN
jgi:CheY-like chemotaxis protein